LTILHGENGNQKISHIPGNTTLVLEDKIMSILLLAHDWLSAGKVGR